jgi:hypothetical protein
VLGGMASGLSAIIAIAPAIATAFGVIKIAGLALMANPVILGFAAVLAGIYLAWQNWDKITEIVSRVYIGVKTWLIDKLGAVFDRLRRKIEAVTGFFFDMYDAVVGNSYVPDMVEEIGVEFGRLQGLMVDPAQKAADDVKTSMRNMAGEVAGLLARLFPQIEEARRQAADIALLREAEGAGLISASTRRAGVRELQGFNDGPLAEVEALDKAAQALKEAVADDLAPAVQKTTTTIAESFGQMADRTLQALDRMTNAIRGGGFLDILGGVLNFGLQLGSMGAFGKGVQANINRAPSFAGGGFTGFGARSGGLDGKGGFLAMMHPNETVIDHTRGAGGGSMHVTVGVDPRSGNLTAFVNNQIAATAPAIASAGAAMAQGQMAQRARRRVR